MFKIFIALITISIFSPIQLFCQSKGTIQKCKNDLLSKDEKIRQRAVLVLGKYNETEATNLLLTHLKDKSKLVRRSSLISLQDRIQRRLLSGPRVIPILDLLFDEDVEVRRTAATLTKDFYGNLMASIRRPGIQKINSTFEQKFLNAFKDKDDIVRLNLLTTLAFNRRIMFQKKYSDVIHTLISDSNTAIIILALNLMRSIPTNKSDSIVKSLLTNKNTDVLIGISNFIRSKRLKNKENLNTLIQNKELSVKATALKCAIELGFTEYQQAVVDFIQDEANPVNLRLDLISVLNLLGTQMNKLIFILMDDKISSIRAAAINKGNLLIPHKTLKLKLIEKLNDDSSNVRNTCLRLIMMRLTKADSALIIKIFDNDSAEIRKSILRKSMQLKIFNEEIILEAIIDDNLEIRIMAIQYAQSYLQSSKKLKSIIVRSLDDPNEKIKLHALRSLVHTSSGSQMIELFQKYLSITNDEIKLFMVQKLRVMTDIKAQNLLMKISQTKNLKLKVNALLGVYQRNKEKVKLELAKLMSNKSITSQQKYSIFLSMRNQGKSISHHFSPLLADPNKSIRLEVMKYFSINYSLYKESYYQYSFKESFRPIRQIAHKLYLKNKFHNKDTIEKMIKNGNPQFHLIAYQAIKNNYNDSFNEIIKQKINSTDINILTWSLQLIQKHKIEIDADVFKKAVQQRNNNLKNLLKTNNRRQAYYTIQVILQNKLLEFDQDLIALLKSNAHRSLATDTFYALLELNTKTGNEYLNSIDSKNQLYRNLIQAKISKSKIDKRKKIK
ncbi:MAG: hypothetical protein COA79_25015 [Planctomycetota bacterium]|nr:MAG: hypothetical protein COA79_25015 [Planctomycetota bacterium]